VIKYIFIRCTRYTVIFLSVMAISFGIPFSAGAYSARSMILMEESTETILIDINCNKVLPMASTTKIMTALVVLENADLNANVVIPAQACGVEGSSMYLIAGETLSVRDLLYGLMLTSGNDAAVALAIHVGGSEQRFVEMMNERAASLGLHDTNFANPSGLPDDSHYTTARELAIITAHALENNTFREIVSSESAKVPYNNNPNRRTLKNHNKLLYMYDSTIGVKTGFTKKAGRCLVSAAQRDGVTLICVTLNDGDDWNDHMSAFDYGFSKARRISLANAGEISVELHTPDGAAVTAVNKNDLSVVVFEESSVSSVIKAEKFVYAPKSAGDVVGSVSFFINGQPAAQDELCIAEAIEAPQQRKELLFTRIINAIKNFFKELF